MSKSYGIYSGTIGEAEYAHGLDEGRAAADALAEDGFPLAVTEDEARENLRTAVSLRSRAFYVGWLRGFRQVSR